MRIDQMQRRPRIAGILLALLVTLSAKAFAQG